MGVIVNKENTKKSELSRRIDADLKEKMAAGAQVGRDETPDFAEDSEYVKDLNKTGKFSWVWVILIILAIMSIVFIVFI